MDTLAISHPYDIISYRTTGRTAIYIQFVLILVLRVGLLLIAIRILRYALCSLIKAYCAIVFPLCQRTTKSNAEFYFINILLLERKTILRAYQRIVLLL